MHGAANISLLCKMRLNTGIKKVLMMACPLVPSGGVRMAMEVKKYATAPAQMR